MIRRIGIVGAGAWGTALAVIAERAGREVTLWARRPEQAAALAAERENRLHLPGVSLAPGIRVTAALEFRLRRPRRCWSRCRPSICAPIWRRSPGRRRSRR